MYVLVSMALALSLVAVGLVLFGPRGLTSFGRPQAQRAAKVVHESPSHHKKSARTAARPEPAKGHAANGHGELPFEEHLAPKNAAPTELAGAREVRGKVEQAAKTSATVAGQTLPIHVGPADRPPMLVVVIDDLGDHPVFAKHLTELPFPVTMAILPNRPRTHYVASLAAERGLEVILHQPMQPISYPRINPGPGALFTDMDAARVKTQLIANLAQVPNAVGVNNHMGSAFTEFAQGMDVVMSVLHAKKLFFLDSVTSPKSSAITAAHRAGVPHYRRAVFLDNVRNTRTILGQLKTAERLALKNGRAIAIGHPYSETLDALKTWARERDGRVKVGTLTELGPES